MYKLRLGFFILICTISFVGLYLLEKRKNTVMNQTPYTAELKEFRNNSEERLRSETGWLTVVGLTWLSEGDSTIGSSNENKIILPNSTPKKLGRINFDRKNGASIIFDSARDDSNTGESPIEINNKPAKKDTLYPLLNDTTEDMTTVKVGTVSFYLINRKNGSGLRIKDTQAEARNNFSGKSWFEPNNDYILNAEWVTHDLPKKILVPDAIGNLNEEVSPGFARFQLDGERIELHPIQEGDSLFFVFRDKTSGHETYGASRFLYANLPQDGKVTLDFNKAVNPPCAFTKYATCPMPPAENIMRVAIRAGEKKPLSEAH